jgi:sulfite exporter TauE/SafE
MKKTVYVQWMDCISCETILKDALDAVPDIKVISLTHKTWKLTIEYSSDKEFIKLKDILKEYDYSLVEDKESSIRQSKKSAKRLKQFVIWSAVLALLRGFTQVDLTQYIWDYWPTMWLGVAFLVWLVACWSSCLAVTWWIVVSYIEALEDKNRIHLAKTQWLFHLWRIWAFVLWGALLWHLGQTIQISASANATMMMIVWLVLAYVWLQIFWIVPSITKRWFHLPWWVEKIIKKFNDPQYALLVWALTFFLPCWFTQSMQLFAMQTWSAYQWALMLWAYWLGTVPLLLWLWLSAWYFKAKMRMFNKIIAGLLVTFWLITFANGWNGTQSAIWNTFAQSELESTIQNHEAPQEIEKLIWSHLWNRLEPKDILVQANKNYEITIDPSMNGIWCKWHIQLPDGTRHAVLQWQPITFTFNPTQQWTYKLLCNMWSSHGSIVVE